MNSLTIFFPFYNDGGTVERMVRDAYFYGGLLVQDLEVIAVNDGSKDHTLDKLCELKKEFPELKVITHEKNRGYGGALISGIQASTKEWVFYTDGDAQYHLDELDKLWNLRFGKDLINGCKKRRGDGLIRKWIGVSYHKFIKLVFRVPICDVDCDYRLVRGELLRSLDLKSTSGAITVEMVKKIGLKTDKISEIPINHYDREYGTSMFLTPKNVFKTFWDECKLLLSFRKAEK